MSITDVLVGVGLILTSAGLLYNGLQLRLNRRIAHGQFMLQFDEMLYQFADIDQKIKNNDWADGKFGPSTKEEWYRVNRYMGFLENLYFLAMDGVLEIDRMDNAYSNRIVPIVMNPIIYEHNLVKSADGWKDFINLWHLLEKRTTFSYLTKKRKAQQATIKFDSP